jgi:DNA-binding NtrC family response regulator
MATVLLIGTDSSLTEGLAQTLASAGHRTRLARSVEAGVEAAAPEPPLVAVVERDVALSTPEALRLPLAPGGALVLYRSVDAEVVVLPPALQRAALADLSLPLERHRLAKLVQLVEERSQRTGRNGRPTPPEQRAV